MPFIFSQNNLAVRLLFVVSEVAFNYVIMAEINCFYFWRVMDAQTFTFFYKNNLRRLSLVFSYACFYTLKRWFYLSISAHVDHFKNWILKYFEKPSNSQFFWSWRTWSTNDFSFSFLRKAFININVSRKLKNLLQVFVFNKTLYKQLHPRKKNAQHFFHCIQISFE